MTWISVLDRLPEFGVEVLAYDAHPVLAKTGCGMFLEGLGVPPFWWTESGCAYYVTHWMPLPPPPVPGEKET